MKSLFYRIYMLSAIALMFASCKKDETQTVASAGTPGTVTASAANLVLSKANAADKALTISWAKTEYGYSAAVKNTIQISVKGNNFADKQEIIADANSLEKSFTVIDFNALLLKLGLPTGINSVIDVRVKSEISDNIAPIYSNVFNITVNPYPLTSFMYVPGDYQGWNPGTADSLLSATSNGIFEGIIKYNAGGTFEFKLTPEKKWDTAYGDAGSGKLSTTGGNLKVPGAGSYKLTVNLNTMEFTVLPFSWGIIGDAPAGSGWANDIDMTYNNGTQIWSATVVMGTGGFKFRKNHDWGVNFGDKTGDLQLDTESDNNIPVTAAGTYKVEMSLVTNSYTITKL